MPITPRGIVRLILPRYSWHARYMIESQFKLFRIGVLLLLQCCKSMGCLVTIGPRMLWPETIKLSLRLVPYHSSCRVQIVVYSPPRSVPMQVIGNEEVGCLGSRKQGCGKSPALTGSFSEARLSISDGVALGPIRITRDARSIYPGSSARGTSGEKGS